MSRTFSRRATAIACLAVLLMLFGPSIATAMAHPLGNFTINHYARIQLRGDGVGVQYVLDLAEIPSIQEMRLADSDGDGVVSQAEWDAYKQRKAEAIGEQLDLMLDGQKLGLQATTVNVSQPLGQGDLPLVRLEVWFTPTSPVAPNTPHLASFRDRSDPARLGWREIVVQAEPGAALADSSVPARDLSDALRSYPDDLLQNPLDQRQAEWSFTLDGSTRANNPPVTSNAANRPADPFAALVTAADLSPTVVLLALLAAASLGGIHAASPGHGKSIMAAYIIGTQGTAMHAMALALSVTLAHTTGVLVLGVLTVLASNIIFPEQLYPWLTLISGAVVVVVATRFLVRAYRQRGAAADHHHDHDHDHDHDHPHQHHHVAPTWRSLFALGLAGGVVPSGSALVVLLSSIALGRLGFGLVLIVAFGLGMAVVLVTTGVLLVHASRFMLRVFPDHGESPMRHRLIASVPIASAGIMTLLGGIAAFQGLIQLGAFGT
jgi:nickel/cobalt transporter (NicO) family protein